MSVHTVIESLSAYKAIRAQDPSGERVWWTTSPYLLMKLPGYGETVRSPEEGLSQDEFDGLAKVALDVATSYCRAMNAFCSWAEAVDLEMVFGGQITRCFFVTLYKGLLLDRVLTAAAGEPVCCVGDPVDPGLSVFSMAYGRFDTLYARLAAHWPESGISVIKHSVPAHHRAGIEENITHRHFMAMEKILSLINNTPSSLLYKLWRNVNSKGWWRWKGISLWPGPKRTFHVMRDCELIEEAFLGILLRRGRVARMSFLPHPDMTVAAASELPGVSTARDMFKDLSAQALEARGVSWRAAFAPCLELAAERILTCFDGLRRNLSRLNQGFQRVITSFGPKDEVLSIAFNSPLERLFVAYCRKRRIRTNSVDHGVTLGLSEWSLTRAASTGMAAGERAFYHCSRGAEAVRPFAPGQETHIVGVPGITVSPPFRSLQRLLARRLLGLTQGDHVVMVVCDLDRNNFMYGPYQDNDLQFLAKTRQTAEAVCRSFPDSQVVLKLYPTQRYLDEYRFDDLEKRFPNLRIVKNVEFRFIRTAADLIFTSSSQSTLGWVSGAGVAYFYLDFVWAPGRIKGLHLHIRGIDGLSAAILPDAGQVCSPNRESLAQALVGRNPA